MDRTILKQRMLVLCGVLSRQQPGLYGHLGTKVENRDGIIGAFFDGPSPTKLFRNIWCLMLVLESQGEDVAEAGLK